MANNRIILGNGEQFIEPVTTGYGRGPTNYHRTYEEARALIKSSLQEARSQLNETPKHFFLKGEQVLSVRMNPAFTAKSYELQQLVSNRTRLTHIGSRSFKQSVDSLPESQATRMKKKQLSETASKLVFIRGDMSAIDELNNQLDRAESKHTKAFKEEIRRIEAINLLSKAEKLTAFSYENNWEEGRVELVLHPSQYEESEQLDFIYNLIYGGEKSSSNLSVKKYDNGPTFISCRLNKDQVDLVAKAVSLRSARPLRAKVLQEIRSSSSFPLPPLSTSDEKSTITVGLFDGGIDETHPYLVGHAVEDADFSIKTASQPEGVAHGTAVAGAMMYGALNHFDYLTSLPTPKVNIESFRVLPTSDPDDIDLYESIDVIEKVVPLKSHIKFFNVSLGPLGPIDEDNISRFTYALDLLAHKHDVVFSVAVGNDGDQGEIYGRIQAPSDMVNGLAVGAFTDANGIPEHASYSCSGFGREGAKNKPDLLAFGGCSNKPFHLLSPDHRSKALECGTSFSTPLVTSLAAQIQATVNKATPLTSRSMLIHKASSRNLQFSPKTGHGFIKEELQELISCEENEVSILYTSNIQATSSIKLPLLLPPNIVNEGSIEFRWTVGILPKTDPLSSSDYTNICIEDRFHPDSKKFAINPPKNTNHSRKNVHLDHDASEILELQGQGWKLSALPVSDSGNVYKDEHERKLDLKWEPIVRRRKQKRSNGVNEPFLTFHAIPRGNKKETVKFCAIVTMRSTAGIDLYQAIRIANPALMPLQLRTEAELRISV